MKKEQMRRATSTGHFTGIRGLSAHGSLIPMLFCISLAAGCCGSRGLDKVSGIVTLNGQPLAGALVEFHPVDREQTPRPAVGMTDERLPGSYTFRLVVVDRIGDRRISLARELTIAQ